MDKILLPQNRSVDSQNKRGFYSIGVLNRTAAILKVFSHHTPTLTLTELCRATGLPKTTVFRILSTLIEHDFCSIDPKTGEYSLGFALLQMADIRKQQSNWHSILLPLMRDIRAEVSETVAVSVRAGDFRVHIDAVEGLQPMRRHVSLGVRAPLYCSAASKVLLASMEDDEITEYLERTPLIPVQANTIVEKDRLWQQIRQIRNEGYAESQQEWLQGGASVAAPVKDYTGATIAVIDILTTHQRYTIDHRTKCIRTLTSSVLNASAQLGYRDPNTSSSTTRQDHQPR